MELLQFLNESISVTI